MNNKLKFIIAYISILISWMIFITLLLAALGIINIDSGIALLLLIPNIILVSIYHEYKPMTFKNIFFKYTGKQLPSWKTISYKLKILIGIDPKILEEESKKDQK